jgi:hypothetical protein
MWNLKKERQEGKEETRLGKLRREQRRAKEGIREVSPLTEQRMIDVYMETIQRNPLLYTINELIIRNKKQNYFQ